ncbi:MAG: hypothetical protein J3Q66DRAFT_96086 [Benniella sp.]|nr:MAG: hypothetical protein J3Q66DRAFT_96086 [Benniella sp.]
MKITALSFFTIILASISISQVAPLPILLPAPGNAPYSAVNPDDPNDVESGNGSFEIATADVPESSPSLVCAPQYITGRLLGIICKGSDWHIWTDCTDGYRYKGGPFSGFYRAQIICPEGYASIRGGASDH